jgi:hypothetical protein
MIDLGFNRNALNTKSPLESNHKKSCILPARKQAIFGG